MLTIFFQNVKDVPMVTLDIASFDYHKNIEIKSNGLTYMLYYFTCHYG